MADQLFNFGNNSGSPGATGGNQYFTSMPALPGIVPPATAGSNYGTQAQSQPNILQTLFGAQPKSDILSGNKGQAPSANSQYYAGNTLDPTFTKDFYGWLQGQIGKGATPFNLSAVMGSTGEVTQPGQLTAPNNPLVKGLQESFTSGTLADMLKTGSPIDQTPAWQAMIEAQQRNIRQNEANLKEQFNVGGGLVGSPYGSAVTDFESQTAKDQNAMLLQATAAAQEAAQGRKLQAAGLEDNFSQFLQSLDQGSIDRLLQEFIRTRPEYSPLLNAEFGAATTFPPYLQKSQGQGGLAAAAGDASQLAAMILMGGA